MRTGIYNVFFRSLTLFAKFLFILFLGRYSPNELNLGVYGLFVTSVTLLVYFIGFDFYVFNTREIINNRTHLSEKLSNQLMLHLIVYVAIIPIAVLILGRTGIIGSSYLWIFVFLVVAEHLGQEFYRLFTTLEKSVFANIILFIRSGFWVLIVFFDYFVLQNPVDLKKYLIFWLCCSSSAVAFSTIFVGKNYNILFSPPDFGWIVKGLKAASVFFLSSISFQVIQFSDRFIIDFFYGKKMVGIYTMYSQFTNAIEIFTFSAITMVAYPKMIKVFEKRNIYEKTKKLFSKDSFR